MRGHKFQSKDNYLKIRVVRFDDLEIWWPLDGSLSDMSGSNRDASVVGQEQWESGYSDRHLLFQVMTIYLFRI